MSNSMTALTITPGETGDWLVAVQTEAGAAQSLAAMTGAWFTVKDLAAFADPGLIIATLGSGVSVVDAAAGTLRVVLTTAQTVALADGGVYRWDMRLKFADGTVSNPDALRGTITAGIRVTLAN